MKKNIINNKGYSLVELLGVVVLLGILTGVGITSYVKYRDKAANDSYKMMSDNAATAAEEYFMDYPSKKGDVTFQELVDKGYFERPVDPMAKGGTCYGKVRKLSSAKENDEGLSKMAIYVKIDCSRNMEDDPEVAPTKSGGGELSYKSCLVYPKKMSCNNEDGLKFNGVNDYLNMGYTNYDFPNGITMIVRIKFNQLFTDKLSEFYGNWEAAGGGLGVNKYKQAYFNLYSPNKSAALGKSSYISAATASNAIEENTNYIISGTYDNSNNKLRIYVAKYDDSTNNPVTVSYVEQAYNEPYPASTTGIFLGANPQKAYENSLNASNISVSEAVLLDKGLTESEIKEYNNPNQEIDVSTYNDYILEHYKFT